MASKRIFIRIESYDGEDTERRQQPAVLWACARLDLDTKIAEIIDDGYRSENEIMDAWGDKVEGDWELGRS